jgi:glutamate carboxypeptidase
VDAADYASLAAVIQTRLPETLDFLERLVAVNSFTGNRAGVLRNAEIIAEQFRELGFVEDRIPASHAGFGDHQFLSRPGAGGPGLMLVTHLDTVYRGRGSEEWLRLGYRERTHIRPGS